MPESNLSFEGLAGWPAIMQQYRICGNYGELSTDEMRTQWRKKPYHSKIIDHFYTDYHAQSSEIESREVVLHSIGELKKQYPSVEDIPFAENARGITIQADYVEVWQDSVPDRLHHRKLYRLTNGVWEKTF